MRRALEPLIIWLVIPALAGDLCAQERERPERRGEARGRMSPTHADVKYGPHERNVMDVWLAESQKPTPVLVSIHGGGFRGGNKSVSGELLRQCLASGISVAAITYRLTDAAIAPAQFHDGARAVQFLRSKAKEWNFDPRRFAATGGSAGAGISLWLGFHDDLADPKNADPVLRESSRLTCVSVYNGQTTYDPRTIRELMPDSAVFKIEPLVLLFGTGLDDPDRVPPEKQRLFEEVSAMPHLTKDDPPALLTYGQPMDGKPDIHHPIFGKVLKEKMDALGIRCDVIVKGGPLGDSRDISAVDFLKENFGLR
jgi:acetyl esterase/lipase